MRGQRPFLTQPPAASSMGGPRVQNNTRTTARLRVSCPGQGRCSGERGAREAVPPAAAAPPTAAVPRSRPVRGRIALEPISSLITAARPWQQGRSRGAVCCTPAAMQSFGTSSALRRTSSSHQQRAALPCSGMVAGRCCGATRRARTSAPATRWTGAEGGQRLSAAEAAALAAAAQPAAPAADAAAPTRRRRALLLSGAAAAAAALALGPAAASVAPPPAPGLAGRLGGMLPAALPMPLGGPEPVGFPRKSLDLRFAVLLMRRRAGAPPSYDAADVLDFVSMERFQISFWKYRQSEIEQYTLQYKPLTFKAGDLTDPLYFDFISYSQYATLSRALRAPEKVFEERYSCEDLGPDDDESACSETLTRVVRRPAAFDDDAALPQAFSDAAGDRIYNGLVGGFRGEDFGGPPPAPRGAGLRELAGGVGAILGIFKGRGYCLDAAVSEVEEAAGGGGGGRFVVRVTGPATLWGLTALAGQRALVANTHDAMAVAAYLRASGRASSRELELTDTGYLERWEVV
ncbi:MAG: hypothetical protein J3K34DRAFT_389034 [Monoraphidium minutum]|nr:MAG: hypothetical protein J3K34DRAFT_389034 [Monoraphidium minutum]